MGILDRYRSMHYKYKISLMFSILLIFALLVTSLTNYLISISIIKEEVSQYSNFTAHQIGERVDTNFAEISRLSEIIASEIVIRNVFINSQSSKIASEYYDFMTVKELVLKYYDVARGVKNIKNIFIYNSDAKLYYQEVFEFGVLPENISSFKWYQRFLSDSQRYILLVGEQFTDGKSTLDKKTYLLRKIYNVSGQYLGIIGFVVAFDDSESILANLNSSSSVILCNSEGSVIYERNGTLKKNIPDGIIKNILNTDSGLHTLTHGSKKYIAIRENLQYTKWITTVIVPEEDLFKKMFIVRNMVLLITFLLVVAMVFLILLISSIMTRNIKILANAMKMVESGNLDMRVKEDLNDEIGLLNKGFNNMLDRINDLIGKLVRERTSKKESELRALLSQINPHFLFNTLESIRMRSVILGEKGTAELVENLSNLFRLSIDWKEEFIRVSNELQHVKSYVVIQNLRYNNRFNLQINCKEEIYALKIPKMILQPIVENSILHGFVWKSGNCNICIDFVRTEEILSISIEDNGAGIGPQKLQELNEYLEGKEIDIPPQNGRKDKKFGIGLQNVNDRLIYYFGKKAGITIQSSIGEGTRVCFNIPISSGDKEVA